MPRIRAITYEEAAPAAREIFDKYQKERGNIPNMFRTAAYRPEILRTMIAHFRAIMESGTVGIKLKELVAVRTSQINRCDYCVACTRSDFTPREKTALELAERESLDSHNVDDDFWARLREHFDEGEIIELAATIGLFNYFTRFNNALRLETTK